MATPHRLRHDAGALWASRVPRQVLGRHFVALHGLATVDFDLPARAYRVVADSAGDLARQEQVGGRKVVHTEEPDTGFWLRLGVGFLSLLPIEWLL